MYLLLSFDCHFFNSPYSLDRSFGAVALRDKKRGEQSPRSAETSFTVNGNWSVSDQLFIHKTDKFCGLFDCRCPAIGHGPIMKRKTR